MTSGALLLTWKWRREADGRGTLKKVVLVD